MAEDPDRDEQLVAELRGFFAVVDPVPPLVIETAKASLGWRRLDAELAELLTDSALAEEPVALTRGTGTPIRAVTFSSSALTIDIEVQVDGERRTLLGQLSPSTRTTIEVETATEARFSAQSDRLGRFRLQPPGGGPVRLPVLGGEGLGGRPVETSWITL